MDTGCSLEYLSGAMNKGNRLIERERERERKKVRRLHIFSTT